MELKDAVYWALTKQHHERDAFYEEVATLIVESVDYSEAGHPVEIDNIIEKDVNTVMEALGK